MLPLSASPTFTFENDAQGVNGLYREAASQRSIIKVMAGLGRPRQTGPWRLDLYRLCDRERILQFDAEVAHGAVHLRMAKQ